MQEATATVEEQYPQAQPLHQGFETARTGTQRHHFAMQEGGVLHGDEFGLEASYLIMAETLVIALAI
ncbi:hypothetical protein, partial [Escherichia coli]|uniref:hypothetical protein n=1 Tax=Escherichia coli TaxID=562 RepID=UPI001959F580